MANQFVQLKDGANNLFPKSCLIGMDISNLITTITVGGNATRTYTATQDCWAVVRSGGIVPIITSLDGVELGGEYTNNHPSKYYIPTKKGQVLSAVNTSSSQGTVKIYGLKY